MPGVRSTNSMVFAVRIAEGTKGPEDFPPLKEGNRKKLKEYMGQFHVDI